MPAQQIVVRGRVQGVGFRYFTHQTAQAMGILGEVWNRSDGGVEVIAEHSDQEVIDAFVEALEAGPGYVHDIQVASASERGYEGFEIGATR